MLFFHKVYDFIFSLWLVESILIFCILMYEFIKNGGSDPTLENYSKTPNNHII